MSGWTTIRDVESAVIDCLGGERAIIARGGDVAEVRRLARRAWHECGGGRYEDATRSERVCIIQHACDLVAAAGQG